MHIDPWAKHDDELVELLSQSMDELDPIAQQDYLVNILTYPKYKNKTILEVLKEEVRSKKAFEADLEERRKKRENETDD